MNQRDTITSTAYAHRDRAWLERELATLNESLRQLRRQLTKTEQQLAETTRAYNKTVANMVEIVRENLTLNVECDRLRMQAQRLGYVTTAGATALPDLTPDEVRAIRKAMARLHHPDVGGNVQRMQLWNAILDAIE